MEKTNKSVLRKYIKSELTGWKPFDVTWLLLQ